MTDHVMSTTDEHFERDVIKASAQHLVLVDVWAEWCAPCRALMPVLEKLVFELDGQVTLVKVNADECPKITARLGVRSLPTVLLFQAEKLVDQCQGALPEKQLREFLAPYIEQEHDRLKEAGVKRLAAGDLAGLDDLRSAAVLSPGSVDVQSALLSALMDASADQPYLLTETRERLQAMTLLLERDPLIQKARSRYALLSQAVGVLAQDLAALQVSARQNPTGQSAFEYAQALAVQEHYDEALGSMMRILRQPGSDVDAAEVKTSLVALINTCPDAQLANRWRRELFKLLH